MSTIELAEYYAIDLGWPVFPLAPGQKVPPKNSGGFLDATTDLEQLRRWWGPRSRFGIGLACVGCVVLDVDVRDGKPGRESLGELELEHGKLPETWTVRTPSGGKHFYFAAPTTPVARARDVRPGIDVCGLGGYVCAPPTVTVAGPKQVAGAYEWQGDDVGLALLPQWVAELAKPEPQPEPIAPCFAGRWGTSSDLDRRIAAAVRYVEKSEPSIAGERGHDRAWLVARALIHKFELPHAIALEVLRVFNQRCEPPWSERELQHKIASAASARVLPEPARVTRGRR